MVSHGHCYLCHSRTARILFDQASCHNFQHRFLHHFNLGSLDSMCKTTWKRNWSRSLWRPFVTSRLRCSLRYVLDMVSDAKVSFLNSSIWIVQCNANFSRSSPERPGFVERSTFLMDEDDLTCRVHDVSLAEDGLVGAASIMMFITVAYIGTFCIVTDYY